MSETMKEFWRELREITDLYTRRDFIQQLEDAMREQQKIVAGQLAEQEKQEAEEEWTPADDQGYHDRET